MAASAIEVPGPKIGLGARVVQRRIILRGIMPPTTTMMSSRPCA